MTIENINDRMIKIIPDEGKRIALRDRSAVYDSCLYAPLNIDTGNYVELTEEDAETLKKELEEREYADHS